MSEPANPRALACPICGKPSVADAAPFCGKRCADIDLGRWFGERYRVPGESAPSSSDDETG